MYGKNIKTVVKNIFKIVQNNPDVDYSKYFELVTIVVNNTKTSYPTITEEQLIGIDTVVVKQVINDYVTTH